MIDKDKVAHIIGGCICVFATVGGIELYQSFGIGPVLAAATTSLGIGYEMQQAVRGEGQVDVFDAIATAVPGLSAWAIIEGFQQLTL